MRLVGTAGHVDHGKSSLVHALTGIHPDRLKEEQAREMTIDLGFAWLTLPRGETISLVDVPGHEAFIKNMLAGVGGMDVVLFVIAADEGIMPQTREHLAILDLLHIQGGVVALTKTDLPLEDGWLDLVQQEIRAEIQNTVLRDAKIIPVSAKTKRGLTELQTELENVLARVPEKTDRNRPRLPVDRVFTMSGFGTVVTGTLSDGRFRVGDDVVIMPRGLRSRVRGLQAHKQKIETALAGGRVAMNLANIATDEITRGDVIVLPDSYTPTTMLDARVEWLKSAPKPLAHSQQLELFLYAAQVTARVRLLEHDSLAAGQAGWAQLILNAPLIAATGDRFILRYASPSVTVGGGVIVEPHPHTRHRRHRREVIEQLERALQGTPADLVRHVIEMRPACDASDIAQGAGLNAEATHSALAELQRAGEIIALGDANALCYISRGTYARWQERITRLLETYHALFPLRAGMPRQELKQQLNLSPRVLDLLMEYTARENVLRVTEKHVALVTHRVTFDATTQQKVNAVLEQFARAPYNPPSVADAEETLGAETLNALIEQGALVRVAPNVMFTPSAVQTMEAWVLEILHDQREITAAQVRDHFDTSRKYAIAFLEYLDAKRITKRVGDARALR